MNVNEESGSIELVRYSQDHASCILLTYSMFIQISISHLELDSMNQFSIPVELDAGLLQDCLLLAAFIIQHIISPRVSATELSLLTARHPAPCMVVML